VEGREFLEMVQDCFLTQHVMKPTSDSNKTVDIVLSTEPGLVEEMANSDHYTVMFSIPLQNNIVMRLKKEVRCYNKADNNEICGQMEAVQWQNLVEGKDVKQEWFAIKGELLRYK